MRVILALILGVLLVAGGFILGLSADNLAFTGNVVKESAGNEQYTYTKAICSPGNRCVDVVITCANGGVKSIEPVSDVKEYESNWSFIGNNSVICME